MTEDKLTVTVCVGVRCSALGSADLLRDIEHALFENDLDERVTLTVRNCFGQCGAAPVVQVGAKKLGNCTAQGVMTEIERALA